MEGTNLLSCWKETKEEKVVGYKLHIFLFYGTIYTAVYTPIIILTLGWIKPQSNSAFVSAGSKLLLNIAYFRILVTCNVKHIRKPILRQTVILHKTNGAQLLLKLC